VKVVTIPKNKAGDNAKAPSVYLNDKILAEIGGKRDGKITEDELIIELARMGIPRKTKNY
jgi:hypothetical protein